MHRQIPAHIFCRRRLVEPRRIAQPHQTITPAQFPEQLRPKIPADVRLPIRKHRGNPDQPPGLRHFCYGFLHHASHHPYPLIRSPAIPACGIAWRKYGVRWEAQRHTALTENHSLPPTLPAIPNSVKRHRFTGRSSLKAAVDRDAGVLCGKTGRDVPAPY